MHARTSNRLNRNETEDMAVLSLEFASGAFATSSVTLGSRQEMSRLRFCFDDLVAESGLAPYNPGHDPWTFPNDDPAAAAASPRRSRTSRRCPSASSASSTACTPPSPAAAPLPVTLDRRPPLGRAPDRRLLFRR